MSQTKVTNKDIVYQLINFALKHRRVMQNHLDETGVYQAQHRLLMEIARNPNVSQIELAKVLDVSPATIAVSLKKLEKGGYIKREIDPDDQRINNILLTKLGDQVVEQSKQIFTSVDEKVFQGLNEAEKEFLYSILQKLDQNLVALEEKIKLKKERE